jgi:predicted nuclease with TOPRIM domain
VFYFFCQIRELEAELDAEQRRGRDLAGELRKLQRLLAEQKQQTEDERRLASEANEQINQLQNRVKTLKRQLEEAVSGSELTDAVAYSV